MQAPLRLISEARAFLPSDGLFQSAEATLLGLSAQGPKLKRKFRDWLRLLPGNFKPQFKAVFGFHEVGNKAGEKWRERWREKPGSGKVLPDWY